jgi:hypothetical protein
MISSKGVRAGFFISACVWLPLALYAQEQDKPTYSPGGLPIYTGKGSVTEAVDTDKGAVFDIGGGYTLLLPKGLPVGHSRLLTFKFSKRKPTPAQIQKGFRRHGKTMDFNGALNAPGEPIVLRLKMKSAPKKRGQKFVLAMEQVGICSGEGKETKLKHGLCAVWTMVDTEYDTVGRRVIAKLTETGGKRMQLGWIPEKPAK